MRGRTDQSSTDEARAANRGYADARTVSRRRRGSAPCAGERPPAGTAWCVHAGETMCDGGYVPKRRLSTPPCVSEPVRP